MSNTRLAPWCALALVAVLAACGSSGSSKASDSTDKPASGATTTAASSDGSSGGAKKIDACTLLSDADATALLGEPVSKKGPAGGVGESTCEWDTATYHSVSISVGSPDTAPNDKLTLDPILGTPSPIAALNGKGAYAGGQAYFTAGNRLNSIQVVSVAGDADRSKAEQLAVTVAAKIAAAS